MFAGHRISWRALAAGAVALSFFAAGSGCAGTDGLGVVALPFSDAVVQQIADQCTEGLTCAAELPSCAREVIEAQVATDGVLDCILAAISG